MTHEENTFFREVVSKIPPTWQCIRCKKDFPNIPNGPFPYATEVRTNKEGVRYFYGDICQDCA